MPTANKSSIAQVAPAAVAFFGNPNAPKRSAKPGFPSFATTGVPLVASIAVLVTQSMPEGVDTFALIDGVWVCSWQCAKGLAMALRAGLIEVGKNKLASEGRVEKMELVYNYLSSQDFQQCVEGIVESFVTMQADLESEKRSMKRLWNKREKQIDRAISNTAGMYGDFQGIIGISMPTISGLSLPIAESPTLGTPRLEREAII